MKISPNELLELESHYHYVYEKRLNPGVIKLEANVLAPREEIGRAVDEFYSTVRERFGLEQRSSAASATDTPLPR